LEVISALGKDHNTLLLPGFQIFHDLISEMDRHLIVIAPFPCPVQEQQHRRIPRELFMKDPLPVRKLFHRGGTESQRKKFFSANMLCHKVKSPSFTCSRARTL
jgi:hypothetical protein